MPIDKKMKRKILISVGIATVILFLTFAAVMVKMIKENGECVDHPFEYSAQRLKASGGDYACYCDSLDPELLDFTFNEEGINIINPEDNYLLWDLDIPVIEVEGGYEK